MHTYIHVYMHTFLYTDTHLYAPLKCTGWYAGRPDCWRVCVYSWAGGRGESQSKQVEIIARNTNRSTCVRTRERVSRTSGGGKEGASIGRKREQGRQWHPTYLGSDSVSVSVWSVTVVVCAMRTHARTSGQTSREFSGGLPMTSSWG